MKLIKAIITLILCITVTVLLNNKIGNIPPLGKFFDPYKGLWQNAEPTSDNQSNVELSIDGITDHVSVLYDDEHIPHIFAQNDYDLYFVQGYITAKDRLWQMDFQTRYASGRLAEVVGKQALPLDRYQRRMGMVYGAEKMLEESFKDSTSRLLLTAYADGVNAYIKELSPKDYPLEFKILDYKPEPWKPLNSALLLKLMSATLSGGSDELFMTRILDVFGKETTDNLFPNYPHREDPIIPAGTPWKFDAITPSGASSVIRSSNNTKNSTKSTEHLNVWEDNTLLTGKKEENIGSNNWAVSSKKSNTGKPILANDPHLNLTLPSIWYQIQLANGSNNSYGVSIPGAPCVIIGFNRSVAWGVTNVGSDVLDWYQITFKDDQKDLYLYDKQWLKTTKKIEEIKIRAGETVYDTVYYTHYGPISYLDGEKDEEWNPTNNIPENAALKWVAHLPSNDLRAFYELNRAQHHKDYQHALKYFTAPAQNFVYADNQDNIAITSNGYFPLKWYEQGKYILDGSLSENEWQGRIPVEHNPTVTNPARGFVSSANQSPVDQTYPYYLDWQFASYDRGHRINQQLRHLQEISIDSFQRLQMDTKSILADDILDTLIQVIAQNNTFSTKEKQIIELLKTWDHHYDKESIAATVFDHWYETIEKLLWDDKFNQPTLKMRRPSRDRTVGILLGNPESIWFSKDLTRQQNARMNFLVESLQTAVQQLTEQYGVLGDKWQWGKVKSSHVPHLANIKGLGTPKLIIGGSPKTVNALQEKNGPSWRMVIALGDTPTGFGILPGGASGNPGSKFYDNQLDYWATGELKELLFLENNRADNPRIKYQTNFTKK
ncbi:penicillin acylase family protein [Olivibacter sp. SDN3]|uniref:penicillin acylase family protein n=1 Tax=Olivibacter sp. SDN3 TaxID=2764720 RepID=UPI0016517DB0|nr:penicillin acylase family protein [Olivibacter sp. SDN3]QNL49429.1 penicillin acylase family protein [Olivibacter sp. SDN3]